MQRIDGNSGSGYNAGRIQTQEPVNVTKGGRRIKRAGGLAHFSSMPSCCPKRPLSSYTCIQEILRELPSAKARKTLSKHIPISERRAILQERRNHGL